MDTMEGTSQDMLQRLENLENKGTVQGEHSHRELNMIQIDRARYGIKVLGMREKATELNARTHIKKSST